MIKEYHAEHGQYLQAKPKILVTFEAYFSGHIRYKHFRFMPSMGVRSS